MQELTPNHAELLKQRNIIAANTKLLKRKAPGRDPFELSVNIQKAKREFETLINENRSTFKCV